MLDVEVIGDALPHDQVERAAALAAATAGVRDGHVAVEFVDAERITELNARHRGKPGPTDVLSFPIDEDVAQHLTGMDHETDDGEMLAVQAEILGWVR